MRKHVRHFKDQNLWPSFVDVMSSLLIMMLFLMVIFLMTNFISTSFNNSDNKLDEVQKQLDAKNELNRKLISNIKNLKQKYVNSKKQEETLASELEIISDNSKKSDIKNEALNKKISEMNLMILQIQGDVIDKENEVRKLKSSEDNLKSSVNKLTGELQKLNDVFEATDKYIIWQKVQIVELGKKLNRALANKTAELFKVRSTFFEGISQALVDNPNFVLSGDRFSIPSELFFNKQSADIGDEGKKKLAQLAKILKDAMKKFPDDVDWVLRVDGHTDVTPIAKPSKYNSNWELSVDRAVSVVNYLVETGIPANRLAATGFGEFHPIDSGKTPLAFSKNRRIEFKLTEK